MTQPSIPASFGPIAGPSAASARRASGKVAELEPEEMRPDDVLVRIVASGVCHTDIKFKDSWDHSAGPVVLGHEGAGIVEAVGPEISGIAAGDHVVLSYRSCGQCARCRAGHPTDCETMHALTFGRRRPDGTTTTSTWRLAAPLGCGFITGAGTVLDVLWPSAGSTLAVVGAGGGAMRFARYPCGRRLCNP